MTMKTKWTLFCLLKLLLKRYPVQVLGAEHSSYRETKEAGNKTKGNKDADGGERRRPGRRREKEKRSVGSRSD